MQILDESSFHAHQGVRLGLSLWIYQKLLMNQCSRAFLQVKVLLCCHFLSSSKSMHDGPKGYCFPSPQFSLRLYLSPIHSEKGSNPVTHSLERDLAAKIIAHISRFPSAAVRSRMVKWESLLLLVVEAFHFWDKGISHCLHLVFGLYCNPAQEQK
jgi:hypothetical protein